MAVTVTSKGTASSKAGGPGAFTAWTIFSSITLAAGDSLIFTFADINFGPVTTASWNGIAMHGDIVSQGSGEASAVILSINWGSSQTYAASIDAVTGLSTSAFDVSAVGASSAGSAAPATSTTATTAQASELLWGVHIAHGPTGDTDVTTNNGDTATRQVTNLGTSGAGTASNLHMDIMYSTKSATGTYKHSWSGMTSRAWTAGIGTYKIASTFMPSPPLIKMQAVQRAATH